MSDLMNEATKLSAGDIALAIGAVGTAAYGLVDASKGIFHGASNFGFGYIKEALGPFAPMLESAVGRNWSDMIKSHWINGKPKAEQKQIARALIRLGLNDRSVLRLTSPECPFESIEGLAGVANALNQGEALTPEQMNILGRFDATVETILDQAYERADQAYRNKSKLCAVGVSMLLAIVGGWYCAKTTGISAYIGSTDFGLAILVGLLATPLAPISKDLASALSTAANAMKTVRGKAS